MNSWSLIAKTAMVTALLCTFVPSRSQINSLNSVNWRTHAKGAYSNATSTLTNVFETEAQFQTYWERVNGRPAGRIPLGGIDWRREKLIAVNLGPRPNPGHEVVISSVKKIRAAEIQVTYQEQLPMQGVKYPQVVVSPWVIVKMERTAGGITFRGETIKRSTGIIVPPNRGKCCEGVCRCCDSCGCSCKG